MDVPVEPQEELNVNAHDGFVVLEDSDHIHQASDLVDLVSVESLFAGTQSTSFALEVDEKLGNINVAESASGLVNSSDQSDLDRLVANEVPIIARFNQKQAPDQDSMPLGVGVNGLTLGIRSENSSGTDLSGSPLGTLSQLADYLKTQFWSDFGDSLGRPISHRNFDLSTTGPYAKDGSLTYNTNRNSLDFNGLEPGRADLVDEAFKLFEATLGIDFEKTDSSGADFRFGDGESDAFSLSHLSGSTTVYSEINVASDWFAGSDSFGDYVFHTILHEIGHGLGLGHLGNYNHTASYLADADFRNDSWQLAMMSYFAQSYNSYFPDSSTNTSIEASFAFLSTPMVVDWIALDDLYGSQGFGINNAFTGDTTYGFNTTITADKSKVFNELKDWIPTTAYTIVDGGGVDTLDLSGFSSAQFIDLRPSDKSATNVYISNIAGKAGNLSFAPGTLIEAAIGGSGADTFRGNSANNSLDGGDGIDTVFFSGALSDYGLSLSGSSLQITDKRSASPDGIDMLANIEFVDFNGDTRSWDTLLSLVGSVGGSGSGGSISRGGVSGSGGGVSSAGGRSRSSRAGENIPIVRTSRNTIVSIENSVINGRRYFGNHSEKLIAQSGINIGLLGGNDFLEVIGGESNFANGNNGEDHIILRGGQGRYLGGADNDKIEVYGSGAGSWVNGNNGSDVVIGSVDGMVYRGGAHNDQLVVSAGTVWGDKGVDTFHAVAGAGVAKVQDYTVGVDVIRGVAGGGFTRTEQGLSYGVGGDQMLLLLGVFDEVVVI